MQHLFLTSIDVTGFLSYIDKPAQELKVAYTPTAANLDKNPRYIDEDRKLLHEAGIAFTEFNLKNIPDKEAHSALVDILNNVDVLVVSGGNTFYLLQETLRTQFDEVIKEKVANNVWYVGTSAGAVLAGTTLDPIVSMDDPQEAPNLTTHEALHLVNFVIIPHFGDGQFRESSEKAVEICKENDKAFVAINNAQSILVEEDTWRIIEK